MAIFTIADLHLSLGTSKPMDIFGAQWANHEQRIQEEWEKTITKGDTVVIPGDISWAMTLDEVIPDLTFLHKLPGRKILSKGNHDYWWGTIGKIEAMIAEQNLYSITFMKNNAFLVEGIAICGSRGWMLMSDAEFRLSDQVIYTRELGRLERSLKEGKKCLGESGGEICAFLHYPPIVRADQSTGFTDLLEKYGVKRCFYGHLHGRGHKKAFEGKRNGVVYTLISGDYISFKPLRL